MRKLVRLISLGLLLAALTHCSKGPLPPTEPDLPMTFRMPAGIPELGLHPDEPETALLTQGPLPHTQWHYARLWSTLFFCPGGVMDSLLAQYKSGLLTAYTADSLRAPLPYPAFLEKYELWMGTASVVETALFQWVDWQGGIVQNDTGWVFRADTLTLFLADPYGNRLETPIAHFPVAELHKQLKHPHLKVFFQTLGNLQLLGVPSRVQGEYFPSYRAALLAAHTLLRGEWQLLTRGLPTADDDADSMIAQLPRYWFRTEAVRDSVSLSWVAWADPETVLAHYFEPFERAAPSLSQALHRRFGTPGISPELVAGILDGYQLNLLRATNAEGKEISYREFLQAANTYLETCKSPLRVEATTTWNINTPVLEPFATVAHVGGSLVQDTLAPAYIEILAYLPIETVPPTVRLRFDWQQVKSLLENRYGLTPETLLAHGLFASMTDPYYTHCALVAVPSLASGYLQLADVLHPAGAPTAGWYYFYMPEADAHLTEGQLARLRMMIDRPALLP